MYKVFRNIPNSPWNALCEFIDNSIQAYLDSNLDYPFHIDIVISEDSMIIFDNGPGFSENNLKTGLEPARIPESPNQLNEFGMGMKLAALYFGDCYSIETSNGNGYCYELKFDLNDVVNQGLTEIEILSKPYNGETFTRIKIEKLSSSTKININLHLNQIIAKLSEVYSVFISNNKFGIRINNHLLTVPEIQILVAPWYEDENGPLISWIQNFEIFKNGFGISGYVALRDPMNNANRGFKLIRRGRVVDGIQNDVKPYVIFGSNGTHLSKRLIGNIVLHGFGISFNKTDILDHDELDALWELLKEDLKLREFSILKQGQNYRTNKPKEKDKDQNIRQSNITLPLINSTGSLPKKSTADVMEVFTLFIDNLKINIQKGTNTGKFIQNENPVIILRADFFTQDTTRNKVIQIIQIFSANTNTELNQQTIIKLIEQLWPHLK